VSRKWHNVFRMTGYLKRLMGLVLVLRVSTWAQAVCPMLLLLLLPPTAEHCPKQVKHLAAASSHSSEHDCCPGKRARMQHEQCDRTKLSSSQSATSCCSVEREPAGAPIVLQAGVRIAVLGRVMPSAMQVPSRAATLELSDAGTAIRGVLNLKEDLRI
jgi:hypothetical protein